LINEKTISILPNPESITVTVVGCGAVGSKVIDFLARLGVNHFVLWDYDMVEEHNVGNQAFVLRDVGKAKVDACHDLIWSINPSATVIKHKEKFTSLSDIDTRYFVISVDSMSARKDILDAAVLAHSMSGHNVVCVDTRIATYEVSLLSFDTAKPQATEAYSKTLYADSKVAKEIASPCGTVQGLGTLSSLAALMAVTKIIHNEKGIAKFGEDIMNIETGYDVVSYTK